MGNLGLLGWLAFWHCDKILSSIVHVCMHVKTHKSHELKHHVHQAGCGLDRPGQNLSLKFISPIPSHCLIIPTRSYKTVYMNLVPCLLGALPEDQQSHCGVSGSQGPVRSLRIGKQEWAVHQAKWQLSVRTTLTTRSRSHCVSCKQKCTLNMTLSGMKPPVILRKPEYGFKGEGWQRALIHVPLCRHCALDENSVSKLGEWYCKSLWTNINLDPFHSQFNSSGAS